MNSGVFSTMGSSYVKAAGNGFYYLAHAPLLLKPLILAIALVYSIALLPIGFIFALFVIFDWLGGFVDSIRRFFLNLMESNSWKVDDSLLSFIFRPIFIIVLSPIFLLSLFIPKLSSSIALDIMADNDAIGAFHQVNQITWRAAKRLFQYVANTFLLLMPITAIIAIVYSIALILIGLIFALLIPLDWISQLVEKIRQSVVRYTDTQQQKIRYSLGAFLFVPIWLTILAPLFLILLVVPKFTSQFDGNI
jgi:hypothetical protein